MYEEISSICLLDCGKSDVRIAVNSDAKVLFFFRRVYSPHTY